MTARPAIPRVGDKLPRFDVTPTELQLFAFSAATWNTHRIHYDADYARAAEGYPGVLVQSPLFAAFFVRGMRAAYGHEPKLRSLRWQNRHFAVAGETLTVSGDVADVTTTAGGTEVALSLRQCNARDELCVNGSAVLLFGSGPR